MKKIGLCICYSVKNYGSMLQAYATQQYVEKSGLEYEIIRYNKKHDLKFYIKSCLKLFNSNFRKEVLRIYGYKKNLKNNQAFNKSLAIRNSKFDEFEKNYFRNLSEVCTNYEELLEKGKQLSAYLVGSDQLWLPAGLSTNFYNLNFASDASTKISYATSFGVSKIPNYQKKRTAAYLKRIDYLSVREQKGVQIVKEVADKDAELVVDPTLLLSSSEWAEYIPPKSIIDEKYIFVYFIGNNPEQRKIVEELRTKTGLIIVALRHIDEYIPEDENFGDIALYDVGPAEFVNLIRNASYICTDSFHGSVFSIINKKSFIIFNRFDNSEKNSTNSRIDSLCNILNLNDRRFNKAINIYAQMIAPINYEDVNEKLNSLRQSSISFLNRAFSSIEEK